MNKILLLIFSLTFAISCSNGNDEKVFEVMACTDREAPVEFIKATEKPIFSNGEFIKENAGEYPEMARRAEIEGTVEIIFQITATGEAQDVYISKGIGGGADETSLRAVQNSQFIPATFKNEPLCTNTKAQALFNLDNPENVILTLDTN
ncbi:energy transducer TonB [Gracilimonas sp.]|uniref:energy transducer TonB n=1 Tax=Gracilimonas sp. TaxID=1974203 RepID=UPI0032EE25A7